MAKKLPASRTLIAQIELGNRLVTDDELLQFRYDNKKRAALETWAGVLIGIVGLKHKEQTTRHDQRAPRTNVYEFKPQPRAAAQQTALTPA